MIEDNVIFEDCDDRPVDGERNTGYDELQQSYDDDGNNNNH